MLPVTLSYRRFHLWSILAFVTFLLGCDSSPIQITKGPHLQNVTQTSITLMWETSRPSISRVQYTSTSGVQHLVTNTEHVRIHRVLLEGLEPQTHYTYRVASGFDSAEGAFRTAARIGAPFRFVVYGNSDSTPERHQHLAQLIGWAEPDFILNVGHLIGSNAQREDWQRHVFEPLRDLLSHVPLYACAGEQATDSDDYAHTFALPIDGSEPPSNPQGAKSWYAFDYGNARFIALDSTKDMEEYGSGSVQYRWLEQQLQDNPQPWTCVYFHHPPYSSGRHGSNIDIREAWEGLFMKYGVDLVFSGHDPIYERTYPIRESLRQDSAPVTYLVTGGGGSDPAEIRPQVWTAHSDLAEHFLVVEIHGERLDLVAYRDDGQVLDTLTIHKQDGEVSHELEPITSEQIQLEQYLQEHLELPFLAIDDAEGPQTLDVAIRNPLSYPVTMTAYWDPPTDSVWRIEPNSASAVLEGGQDAVLQFQTYIPAQRPYPAPSCRLHYLAPFGEGEIEGPALRSGVQRHLACPRIPGPIQSYGQIIEAGWFQAARTTTPFLQESLSGPARLGTQAQIGHDGTAFHIAFELAEPHPDQLSTQRVGAIDLTQDDAVGVYLGSPEGEVWLFAVNAKGVQYAERNGMGIPRVRWDTGIATHEDHWTVEASIPFACFSMPPRAGQTWGLQLLRNSRLEGKTLWNIGEQTSSLGSLEIK